VKRWGCTTAITLPSIARAALRTADFDEVVPVIVDHGDAIPRQSW
jgi:hypothetical protein